MGSSEFTIYPLDVGAGQVALSPIPGRSGSYEADLSAILHWAPDLVLTMTTQSELDRMGGSGFGDDLAAVGVAWRHLPIVGFNPQRRHLGARRQDSDPLFRRLWAVWYGGFAVDD
jgi:hypothetical protein